MIKKQKERVRNWLSSDRPAESASPSLRFSPTAWARLLFLRDYGNTEVGGFGIAASDDLLLVEDVQLVKQVCSWAHVALDDNSVADFFDQQVDAGRRPQQFGRIWLHTHPGDCPQPSRTDEETFDRVFDRSDWAVMFILANGGQMYSRLRFNVGPRAEFEIPVDIDYTRCFGGCDWDAWEQEYLANVRTQEICPQRSTPNITAANLIHEPLFAEEPANEWRDEWFQYIEEDDNRLR